ncbi:MAG: hypothetical protein IH616_19425 [Gemmatimonadales bacterium]|nr:hypothetical protein [Gemmatimonadales bacterium]
MRRSIVTDVMVLLLSVSVAWPVGARGQTTEEGSCRESDIEFHAGTLERLVGEPEAVLADEAAFWSDEPPQRYVRQWSEGTRVAIPYDRWRERVQELADLPETERRDHPLTQMTRRIVAASDTFLQEAVPHVCSFLPPGASLDIGVHFTAFVPPRSFVSGEVVINVSAEYWQGNVANILNNLVHEIFHVGYSNSRPGRTEPKLENEQFYGMLDDLQNEGLATYVAYEAQGMFPAPGERDYPMLDDPAQVRRLRNLMNGLFAQTGTVSEDQLTRWAWTRGVTMRGYYVTGAHMARTIDAELGREALIDTIRQGPVSFVRRYNTLVPEEDRIVVPGVAGDG